MSDVKFGGIIATRRMRDLEARLLEEQRAPGSTPLRASEWLVLLQTEEAKGHRRKRVKRGQAELHFEAGS